MSLARVLLVRHGETNENRQGIIQGHRDTLLNEAGKAQAKQVAEALADVELSLVYSSDLKRASETAETIIRYHDSVKFVKTKELRERGLGKWEGQPLSVRRNMTGFDDTAESTEAFSARALAWWDSEIVNGLCKQTPEGSVADQRTVLLVSHGGFISGLVRMLIKSGRIQAEPITNWTCFNVSVTTIEMENSGKGRLVKYSDTTHLDRSKLLHANADTFVSENLS
ncbi:phosphoglycerate mutase-like protein [Dendrothele bispora CBS 962.96]|uniref:Phosphoglycerate mutase-like protein n=1 Tax=Dendrothele bispora (strain CBS 962.96) TaxID=1314807 RepID=A0A4S8MM44_DENBC|nr:phosphoglycerate mutase-like protein [Dendrothele bispora CBS 962.96]